MHPSRTYAEKLYSAIDASKTRSKLLFSAAKSPCFSFITSSCSRVCRSLVLIPLSHPSYWVLPHAFLYSCLGPAFACWRRPYSNPINMIFDSHWTKKSYTLHPLHPYPLLRFSIRLQKIPYSNNSQHAVALRLNNILAAVETHRSNRYLALQPVQGGRGDCTPRSFHANQAVCVTVAACNHSIAFLLGFFLTYLDENAKQL